MDANAALPALKPSASTEHHGASPSQNGSRFSLFFQQGAFMSNHIISTRGGAMAAEGHKTRRAALRTFVGVSAFAIRTIRSIGSALGDPIFPVIERHLATWRAVEALVPTIDAVAAERRGREVTQADWDAYEGARTLEDRTLEELLATPPTTFAGMRAAIEYLAGFEDAYLKWTPFVGPRTVGIKVESRLLFPFSSSSKSL
jgi:hypothetical protein